MAKRIAFWVGVGAEVGFGHLSRCSALARVLSVSGAECVLFTKSGADVPTDLARTFVSFRSDISGDEHFDCLVLDDYAPDLGMVDSLASRARFIAIIGDLPDHFETYPPDLADLLISATPLRSVKIEETYRAARWFGPDYALIRANFTRNRFNHVLTDESRSRHLNVDAGRIAVMPGATDPSGLSLRIVPHLLGEGWCVDLPLASSSPALAKLEALRSNFPDSLAIHCDAGEKEVVKILGDSTFWIGTASTGCWERCTLGVPGIALVSEDNQADVGRFLQENGLDVKSLSVDGSVNSVRLRSWLCPYRDAGTYQKSCDMATRICDGLGAFRVASALMADSDKIGRSISLRAVTDSDIWLLHEWQSAPGVRRFSRNPDPPGRHEHERWFHRKLHSNRSIMMMVCADGKPVGHLRLDLVVEGQYTAYGHDGDFIPVFEISILVDPCESGRGVATEALYQARILSGFAERRAYVKSENLASLGLFRAAGYSGSPNSMYQEALL